MMENNESNHIATEDVAIEVDGEKCDEKQSNEEIGAPTSSSDIEDEMPDKDVTVGQILREYLPWISSIAVGVILLIVAVVLFTSTGSKKISLSDISMPSFQTSMKVVSVDGKTLRYTKDLKYIGNLKARSLRQTVEPKLVEIYKDSGLDAKSVLTLAFKYGGSDGEAAAGRSSLTENTDGIIVLHWVFLKSNTTLAVGDILKNMKTVLKNRADIAVDSSSISVIKLENFTSVHTLTILTQYGFFKNGLRGLDMQVFAALSDDPNRFGIQTEGEDGLCSGLSKPNDGNINPPTCMESKNTYMGLLCTTSCDDGFQLVGSSLRSCLSNGKWSGQMATCKAICPPLPVSKLGSIHPPSCGFRNMSVGDMCFMQCHHLSQLFFGNQGASHLSHIQECLSNGMWSGEYGTCKALCPRLADKPHQIIHPSSCLTNPIEGDVCMMQCDNGYVLDSGGSTYQVVCDVSGNWDRDLPQCNRKCSDIVVGARQSVTPAVCAQHPFEGIRCRFSCDPGYKLVGKEISSCMSDGTWSAEQPMCVQTCDQLQKVENGLIQTLNGTCNAAMSSAGSSCMISCSWGFVPTVSQLTCQSSTGSWSDSSAKCQRFCDVIMSPNGVWSPSTCASSGHHVGFTSCDLICSPSYTVIGDSVVECNPNTGMWNATPGVCGKRCSPLSSPSNGIIDSQVDCTSSVDPTKTCTFTCDPGYILDGNKMLTCHENGQWSSSAPTCISKRQFFMEFKSQQHNFCLGNTPTGELVKYFNASMGCTSLDKSYHWSLLSDYNIKNSLSGLCIATSENTVKMMKCNSSNSKQHFVSHTQYVVSDNSGYFLLSGHRTTSNLILSFTLDTDVQWRFTDISDLSIYTLHGARNNGSCLPPEEMLYVDFQEACKIGPQEENTVCSVTCGYGYKLAESNTNVQCQNGAWNISESVCEPNGTHSVQCPPLNYTMMISPYSCSVQPQDVLSSCTMECVKGDEYLFGPNNKICDPSGRWVPNEKPICRKYCNALSPPADTYYVSADASHCWNGKAEGGDTCSFACKDGFVLVGSSILTCTDMGVWDNTEPTCFKYCEMAMLDASITVSCDKTVNNLYPESTTCTFSCQEGFQITGRNSTLCSDGNWDFTEMPQCVSTCPPLTNLPGIMVESEDCEISSMPFGTQCKLSCLDGYFMTKTGPAESALLTCADSHLWIGVVPQCVDTCMPLDADEIDQTVDPPSCSSMPQPVGTVCNIVCLQSASLGNSVVATCGNNRNWTSTGPLSCSHKCNALPVPDHATITPEKCTRGFVDKGTVCAIQCPDNMDTLGPAVRVCLGAVDLNTGLRWSGVGSTYCLPRCPPLHLPPATHAFPQQCSYRSMVQGDTCSFECEQDYNLNGANILECTANGMWSDLVPSCVKFCSALQVRHGYLSCVQEISPYSPQGYMHIPGTQCTLYCDEGFAPVDSHSLICLNGGAWDNTPDCQQVSGMFNILQKIGNETQCLVANSESLDVSLVNSSESCISSGSMGLWYWSNNYLKHAGTGLCLSAKQISVDGGIELMVCNLQTPAQQWDCDAFKSYRIVVKNTTLGIDTSLQIGPVLKNWKHAKSFWMTFNKDLETLASICSYKSSGTCPGIVGGRYSVEPSICASDQIEAWQTCTVSCKGNSGKQVEVQCLPTGVWKNIDSVECNHECPPLPDTDNHIFTPSRCSSESMEHMGSCLLSCNPGTLLSNGESQVAFVCDDGMWSGEDSNCKPNCNTLPVAPENVTLHCDDGMCKARCSAGFMAVGETTVEIVACQSNGSYNATVGLKCRYDEGQFMIQAASATSLSVKESCLSVVMQNMTEMVVKSPCSVGDYLQYWKWLEDSLQNTFTGKCISLVSTSDGNFVTAMPCVGGQHQNWKCINQHFPFHLASQYLNGFLEFGEVQVNTPVMFKDMQPVSSAEWVGVRAEMPPKTICSFKKQEICPPLMIGPTATVDPADCQQSHSNLSQECMVSCKAGYDTTDNGVLMCSADGLWDKSVPSCLAKTSLNGFCTPITLSSNLKVNSECMVGETIPSGTLCAFSCFPGYTLSGSKYAYCDVMGLWTDEVPDCKGYCPGLNLPMHSDISPSHCSSLQVDVGSECVQSCKKGYASADGSVMRTCKTDGKWSNDPIYCQKFCAKLSENDSFVIDMGEKPTFESNCANKIHFQGDVCVGKCEQGYVLVGKKEFVCQSDGTWSHEARCIPSFKCPEPSMSGVQFAQYKYKYGECVISGTTLHLTCQTGYRVDGDQTRICQSNGNWSGNGPAIPQCVQNCGMFPAYMNMEPQNCTEKPSTEGAICFLQCPGENVQTECLNSQWTNPAPVCSPSMSVDTSLVKNQKRNFLILTRQPFVGCLSINENDTVIWIEQNLCDPQNQKNKWHWLDEEKIANVYQNKCMKAISSNNKLVLGVGDCNSDPFKVHCGNSRSSNQRMSVHLSKSSGWKMDFEFNLTSALPHTISVEKLSPDFNSVSQDLLNSLSFSGNDDVEYSESSDKPICSYMCGGVLTSATNEGYISSPGYFSGNGYPANIDCEWLFIGYKEQLILTVIDLDLDEDSDTVPCGSDCLEVYRGSNNEPHESELVSVFAGRSLSKYTATEGDSVHSVTGNMYVKFSSNARTQNKGFAIKFEYKQLETMRQCGVSSSNSSELIINKHKDLTKDFPWVVSIYSLNSDTDQFDHICSGVLLNENTVLSAAHCTSDVIWMKSEPKNVFVAYGNMSSSLMTEENLVHIKRIFVHPHYSKDMRQNNLALWKTSVDLSNIQLPCLPKSNVPVHAPQEICYSLGWMNLDQSYTTQSLMSEAVIIDSIDWCQKELGLSNDQRVLCALYNHTSTLSSKSESLFCIHNNVWYLVGMASHTHSGLKTSRRLYTTIHNVETWLNDILTMDV